MYRMPEKQTGSWTVSNCAQCCFYQYANHLPFRLLSIKLKYRGFLMTSRFAVFHFMLILKRMNSFMWINFTLSKGKNFKEMCFYNHSDIYEDQPQVGSWVQRGEFIHTHPAAEWHG